MFPNSEVEPWVDVNPMNPDNIVGSVQQDRWSNGGARGLVAAASFNGGTTWQTVVIPKIKSSSVEAHSCTKPEIPPRRGSFVLDGVMTYSILYARMSMKVRRQRVLVKKFCARSRM